MSRLSIIIPVYNAAQYLRKCLDSVLAQTYADWEAICVDDGSTDGSNEILDEYVARDSRFRIIRQKNLGVSVARQSGLEAAKGEYLGAVDGDDWIDPDYFERLIETADLHNADMVFGGFTVEYDNGTVRIDSQRIACESICQVKALLEGTLWGAVWTRVFKSGFLKDHNVSYPRSQVIVREDVCFVASVLRANPRIARCDGVGYHYYRRENSVSHVQITDEYYCSHLNVEDYLDSCFAQFEWARDSLQISRQNVMIASYLAPLVHDNVFFSRCAKTLPGSSVPVYHKFMYWLALRGCRRLLIRIVGCVRLMKKWHNKNH